MLQPYEISIGLKEHSNPVTPKAYTPKSPSGPLPPDSGYLRVFHYSKEQLICGRKSYYGALLCCAWSALSANPLTGLIPAEVANISPLQSLTLEFNQLSRNLPPELGNLPNLQRLLLTSNNFTGELPTTFPRLTTLQDVELSFNKLSGQIPSSFEYGLRKTDYIDLSYNNFTMENSGKQPCQLGNVRSRGVNKAVTKSFTIVISSNTLEIRLYWAGKETIGIPFKSVYGRLISAIPVNPRTIKTCHISSYNNVFYNNQADFILSSENGSSMSAGSVAAIVAGVVVFLVLVFELKGLKLQMGIFTLRQIKAATNNFNKANKIGEGGFGPVYKGNLSDGTIIAVKQLSSKSRQGNREFLNELGMISALQHPCLVKLYGCCVEGDQLLLVYDEYMENNSLARTLFGPAEYHIKLDWPTRQKICVGIARAKLDEEDNTHISTRIAGTYGYMAPEYTMHGYLTDKADVYSFGVVVALEIVSGRSNMIQRQKEEAFHLLDWVNTSIMCSRKCYFPLAIEYLIVLGWYMFGNLIELVDRRLGLDFYKNEVTARINVSLLCTNVTASLRPTMSLVVSMLEGRSVVQEVFSESSEALDEKKLEAM
ncbi:putative leucine-rich repeat receptor-like serine/threonine-protein kinase [Glycine soja]|uniref:Putative leucine-rich repeat receptor-like serine/threonine-protein kinase n=1 Tax=Glycine soja TaxID=3848 RepID=A0A445KDT9_GLYSO|nr:putative leucine-rich repeat receptor-like serine/threonine-protein kinase [Glycine soja]